MFGIALSILRKILTPQNIVVLVVLCTIVFQYYTIANLERDKTKLLSNQAVLEVKLKNAEALLDEGNKRYEKAVSLFDNLDSELKLQQQLSSKKIQYIIQQQTPVGCDNSINYLKNEAVNIKWPE